MTSLQVRGTGRTTKQLKAMRPNGVFVWCNEHMQYISELVYALGRKDILVVPPSYVTSDKWLGREFSEVVLDHAYCNCNKYNSRFQNCFELLRSRCRDK